MYAHITGTLTQSKPLQIVILTAGGMAYDIAVPMSTLYQLPSLGQTVTLYLHLLVREDAHLLYGFISESERETFRSLIKVNGIGAKIALAILSGLSSEQLQEAIAEQNINTLVSIPGIGKKTAERLVLELKDKVSNMNFDHVNLPTGQNAVKEDVIAALMALGYADKEARTIAKNLPAEMEVNSGVRWALQQLSK